MALKSGALKSLLQLKALPFRAGGGQSPDSARFADVILKIKKINRSKIMNK
jgi:hypothetical protein